MTINEAQDEIIDEFEVFDEWLERYQLLVDFKGIVALLLRVLNDHTPKEILDADLYFIDRIGLREHLSPTRSNGIAAMLKQMRLFALAYQAK